jgi:hypothetical protein
MKKVWSLILLMLIISGTVLLIIQNRKNGTNDEDANKRLKKLQKIIYAVVFVSLMIKLVEILKLKI